MTANNKPIPTRISNWSPGTEIVYCCPKCGTSFAFFRDDEKFCHNCGLRINWENVPKNISKEQKNKLDIIYKEYCESHHDYHRYRKDVEKILFEVYCVYK